MSTFGCFEGNVIARWKTNPDGPDRDMELVEDFAYVDPAGKRWQAKAGRVVNGASIPKAFWNWKVAGPPYVGDYRRASVIHDVACEDQTEPPEAVHLMFYHAMLCGGVKSSKALAMYHAVKQFCPSWDVGPTVKASRTMPLDPTPDDLQRLETAAEAAIEELGPEAGIEALDAKIEAILSK